MNEKPSPQIVGASEPRKYMRLPTAGKRDPIYGFSRSFINSLILPCKDNDYYPPVLSFVLKKAKARHGVRLVDIASIEAYIAQHPQQKGPPDSASSEGSLKVRHLTPINPRVSAR
jgi:hypothetical protein